MRITSFLTTHARYARYGLVVFVALLLVVPRFALLSNAPRVERIADTYTHEVLALGQVFQDGRASEFIASVHKYPLLGPYLALPVVGVYYLFGRVSGALQTPAELADAYLRGESALPLLFRIESLLFNVVALFLIFRSVKEFSPGRAYAGLFAILAAGVSFYVTVFSVSPRIHNLVFLFSALTLYLSLRYYRARTRAALFTAFGAAGLAFAAAQSGLPAVLLPLTALFLAHMGASGAPAPGAPFRTQVLQTMKSGAFLRLCVFGLFFFGAVALVIGYPGALSALIRGDFSGVAQVFLSSEHSDPSVSILGLFTLLTNWVRALELVSLWPLLALGVLFLVRKHPVVLEGSDYVALSHVVGFLVLFGFSSVTVGRFSLAVLPSLFFLGARAASDLIRYHSFRVPLIIFFVLQLAMIGALSRAAFGGDTREHAASFLLSETTPAHRILSNMPRHALGILATPNSLRAQAGEISRTDAALALRNLTAPHSRHFYYWNPTLLPPESVAWRSFAYVILREPTEPMQTLLSREGFALAAEFLPYAAARTRAPEDFNWDFFGTDSALALFRLNRFGPAISIFKNTAFKNTAL